MKETIVIAETMLVYLCYIVFSALICSAQKPFEENDWTFHRESELVVTSTSPPFDPTQCFFENKTYRNGQRISVNVCINCFCHLGKFTCYHQNCPPPPIGCEDIPSEDSCRFSAYNCTIPEKHQMPLLRREAKIYGQRRRGLGLVKADCIIRGIAYFVGETVGVASSDCLQCRCAKQSLLCIPLCCHEPISPIGRNSNAIQALYHRTLRQRDPHPLDHL